MQQTTDSEADNHIFSCIFYAGVLRVDKKTLLILKSWPHQKPADPDLIIFTRGYNFENICKQCYLVSL